MSLHQPLEAELEAQAQELAARIRARADSDILALARLPVGKGDAEVFGGKRKTGNRGHSGFFP